MNWDLGRYEDTAAKLSPAADAVVARLAPQPGEHVLDLGCGTGNAALLAAQRGAQVTGVDPAPRLLEVARTIAAGAGLEVGFAVGDAAHLPVPDRSVDAVVSVFGVIFAPDAPAAAREIARVVRPGGRLVLSAWIPGGALAAQSRLRRERMEAVRGEVPGIAPFAWHDADALRSLLAPHGFTVELREETLAFTADSPTAYTDSELAQHPMWVQARGVLEPAGHWDQVRDELVELHTAANEDRAAFRLTSRYVIATATASDR